MDHKVPWPGVPFRVVSKVQSPFDLSFDELFDIDLPGTNFQYLEFGKRRQLRSAAGAATNGVLITTSQFCEHHLSCGLDCLVDPIANSDEGREIVQVDFQLFDRFG